MHSSTNNRSPYEVLNVSPEASDEEIKKRFRELARSCHPDTNPTKDDSEFQRISEAYDLVCTAERRAQLSAPGRVSSASYTATAPATGSYTFTGSLIGLLVFRRQAEDYFVRHGLGYQISGGQEDSGGLLLNVELAGAEADIESAAAYMDALIAREQRIAEDTRRNVQVIIDEQAKQAAKRSQEIRERTKQNMEEFYGQVMGRFFQKGLPVAFFTLAAVMGLMGATVAAIFLVSFAVIFAVASRIISVSWTDEAVLFSWKKPWRTRSSS